MSNEEKKFNFEEKEIQNSGPNNDSLNEIVNLKKMGHDDADASSGDEDEEEEEEEETNNDVVDDADKIKNNVHTNIENISQASNDSSNCDNDNNINELDMNIEGAMKKEKKNIQQQMSDLNFNNIEVTFSIQQRQYLQCLINEKMNQMRHEFSQMFHSTVQDLKNEIKHLKQIISEQN